MAQDNDTNPGTSAGGSARRKERKAGAAANGAGHEPDAMADRAFDLVRQMYGYDASYEEACCALRANPTTRDWFEAPGSDREVERYWEKLQVEGVPLPGEDEPGEDAPGEDAPESRKQGITETSGLVLRPEAPMPSASAFIARHYKKAGLRTLHHQQDTFYAWQGTHYAEIAKEEMRGRLWAFLDTALREKEDGGVAPFDPTKHKVANVQEAATAKTQLPSATRPPTWLDTASHPPADELIACANGLLHFPKRVLLPHTPVFFTLNALPFSYNPAASQPGSVMPRAVCGGARAVNFLIMQSA